MNETVTKNDESTASMIATVRNAMRLSSNNEITRKKPRELAPLTLAYIGDTVYDLYVRTYLIDNTDRKSHGLHMLAKRMVCAEAQAKALSNVQTMFTDEESDIFRRGRNAHIGTVPRHATIGDYRAATGFEAVLGYLLLSGSDARISELMSAAIAYTTPLDIDRE